MTPEEFDQKMDGVSWHKVNQVFDEIDKKTGKGKHRPVTDEESVVTLRNAGLILGGCFAVLGGLIVMIMIAAVILALVL